MSLTLAAPPDARQAEILIKEPLVVETVPVEHVQEPFTPEERELITTDLNREEIPSVASPTLACF